MRPQVGFEGLRISNVEAVDMRPQVRFEGLRISDV